MKIKKASILEVNKIAPLFQEYREISVSHNGFSSIEDSKTWLHDRMSKNEAVIFVAVENDNVNGFAILYNGFSSISLQRYWILNDLYVIPSCRSKGYAKMLISEIHKFAIESKSKGVGLETAYSNNKAQNLYEKLGYRENNLYKEYFWDAK